MSTPTLILFDIETSVVVLVRPLCRRMARRPLTPAPTFPIQTTTKRPRYAKVGDNRFVVRAGRGAVLGHVLRTPSGYMIEGHGSRHRSLREVLGRFHTINKSYTILKGLLENVCT